MNEKFTNARWINTGFVHINSRSDRMPAPLFRREFEFDGNARKAEAFFCGLGWGELYLNGRKVGDRVLDPVVTQFDRRAGYVRYDLSGLLKKGKNVFGVILGNGWYNCSTNETWHFKTASWIDYPKFIFALELDGESVLVSDPSWKCLPTEGPIRFNELREGEHYDARREVDFSSPGFDDSAWTPAVIIPGPGGVLSEQTMPPCKVMGTRPLKEIAPGIFDAQVNMTGWARIRVSGASGSEIVLKYSEHLSGDGKDIDQSNISLYINEEEMQTDRYILKGEGIETWSPRFTYHGFRYVKAEITGNARLLDITGELVHTSFDLLTTFESSSPELNKLHEITLRSYVNNFTGIPTDCPHREKNGWTGDAQLAAETGLFHFDAASSYHDWLRTMADVQRPNGQFPGIVPSGGWGFNWGMGPAWDSAFILIPYYVWIYTGQTQIIEENYEAMKRYIRFLQTMDTDHLLAFGLGDWCHVDQKRICDVRITSTGYYYADVVAMKKFALLLGKEADAREWESLARNIFDSFNKTFYQGGGIYGKGEMTSLACALYQGLVPQEERQITAARLEETVRANGCRVDCGILGAKYIPRVLADFNYIDTAYAFITQSEFPGWGYWLKQGATTLWESWRGKDSQDHVMYGDIAAWMIQYPAGLTPLENAPGFAALEIAPKVPEKLTSLSVTSRTPRGNVQIRWQKTAFEFALDLTIPDGVPCQVTLPDGTKYQQTVPDKTYRCRI